MCDTETDDNCVSHDLHQHQPKKVTPDTGKLVRRTRTQTYSTQQDTDKSREKFKIIFAILSPNPRSSIDISPGRVRLGLAQLRKVNPPSLLPNDTDMSKQKQYVSVRDRLDKATARHNLMPSNITN